MTVVDQDDYNYLMKHPDCLLCKEKFVLPMSKATPLKEEMVRFHSPVNLIFSLVYPELATMKSPAVQLRTLPTYKVSKRSDFETRAPEYSFE